MYKYKKTIAEGSIGMAIPKSTQTRVVQQAFLCHTPLHTLYAHVPTCNWEESGDEATKCYLQTPLYVCEGVYNYYAPPPVRLTHSQVL